MRHDQGNYDVLYTYLTSKKLPEKLTKNERDSLKRRCKSFFVKDGLLYHRDRKTSVDQQVRRTRHSLPQQTWLTAINELTRDLFDHLGSDK